MAITLPLPLRVAAGLLATGIDLVKSLPEDIPAIPVTLVGNAMRLSMKFQQEITSLATRGDELLSGVINAPQENPPWAKFDDDEPVRPAPTSPKHAKPNGPAGGGGGGGKSSARTTIDRAVDDQAGNDLAEGVRTTGPRAAPPKSDRTRTTRTKTDRAQPAGSQTVDTVVTAITEGAGKAETEASDALAAEATAAEAKPADAKPADAKPADAKPADPRDADPAGADSSVTTTDGTADTDRTDGNALKTPVASAVAPADTTAMEAALEVSDTLVEQALEIAEPDVGTTGANADAGAATATVPPAPADDLNKAAGSSTAEINTAEINTADLKTVDNIATDNNTTVDDAPTDQQPTDQQPIDARDSDAESVADEHDPAEDLEGRDPTVLTAAAEDGPPALPGYSSMTLAQVRGHLRELSADDIGVLLRYEQDSDNRPPFLTLLSNRLVTLDSQNQ